MDEILEKKNSEKEGHVKLEDLLEELKTIQVKEERKEALENSLDGKDLPLNQYFLMYATRSNQYTTRNHLRVILPVNKAEFIFAFNAGIEGHGKDHLEIMGWISKERRFEFSVVDFSKPHPKREFSKTCHACHGEDLRPNWDTYSLWPGMIGSEDHWVPGERVNNRGIEFETLKQYKMNQQENKRFKHLGPPFEGNPFPKNLQPIMKVRIAENFNKALRTLNKQRICRLMDEAFTKKGNPDALKMDAKKSISEMKQKLLKGMTRAPDKELSDFSDYVKQIQINNEHYFLARYKMILHLAEKKWDLRNGVGSLAEGVPTSVANLKGT